MNTKDKLKELTAAESALNVANNAQGAAWDAYTAAEKVYGGARAASEFINAALDAAQSDFVSAAVALDNANDVRKDADNALAAVRCADYAD